MRAPAFFAIPLLLLAKPGDAAQSVSLPAYATIAPTRLDLPSKHWDELQFVQADLQGRVFVLRGSPALEVFRLEGDRLQLVATLEGATAGTHPGAMWVEQARLSRAGDVWSLFVPPTTIEIFEGGKRTRTIESHWEVTDIAKSAPGLFVAVSNNEINTSTPEGPSLDRPPFVRHFDGQRWATLIQGTYRDDDPRAGASWHQKDLAAYAARLAFTTEGQLWAASAYSPRLRHYSASGVLEDDLVLGDGKIRWIDEKPADLARQQAAIDAALTRGGFRARIGAVATRPKDTFRDLAIGRDGYVYLLAETADGLALDRYLPSLPTYERVLLTGIELGPGRPSLVAGKYGLILGARFGKGGTWEISNEAIQAANWREVPGVLRNGSEITSAPRSPESEKPGGANGARRARRRPAP